MKNPGTIPCNCDLPGRRARRYIAGIATTSLDFIRMSGTSRDERERRAGRRTGGESPAMRTLTVLVLVLAAVLGSIPSGLGGTGGSARAEQVQRIAAIVNNDVISMYDLISRLRMVIAVSNLPDTPETRRRLAGQILRSLIDEHLKLQEAKRLNIKVSKKELDDAISRLEKANNLPPGGFDDFLARNGIARSTVVEQIKANFAWSKVIAQKIRPRVRISDEEVEAVRKRMSRSQGNQEYLLSEIFLGVPSPEQEQTVQETADRLAEQIRKGASFDSLARQFSQSGTASVGGDLGWVQRGQLAPDLDAALSKMRPGQVSDPIKTIAGFYILKLRQQRTLAAKPPEDRTVSLRQIILKLPKDPTPDDINAQRQLAEQISETAQGCADMQKLSKELGITTASALNKIKVKDLSEKLRPLALNLKLGQPSSPISLKDGIAVVMVCQRDEEANLPSRDEIRKMLMRERIDIMTRRYLRDLRLGAYVDVRV